MLRQGTNRHLSSGDAYAAIALWLVVFATHVVCPIRTSFDSRWAIHTALSILYDGDTAIDEYEERIRRDEYYAIEGRDGHLYNRYPLGPTLLALPALATLDALARVLPIPDSRALVARERAPVLEVAVASFLVGAAAAAIYAIGRLRGLPASGGMLLALVFAFCTPAWSTGSRSLMQHGPTMALLSLGLLCIVAGERERRLVPLAALFLSFSLLVRPTNAIPIALLSAYVAYRHPRQLPAYTAIALLVAAPYAAWSWQAYGTLLPPYYFPRHQRVGAANDVPTVLLGHLLSPNRGLLVFSPILAFAAVGVAIRVRRRELDLLDVALLLSIALHWAVVSTAEQWWAGHSYGPRYMADVVPFLTYLMIPVLERARAIARPAAALSFWTLFALLAAWSFFVHYRAATDWSVWAWNGEPMSIDDRPERAWDWSDLQILRGL